MEELEIKIKELSPEIMPVFKSFDDFFEYLFNYLGKSKEPIVFVFDEFQNFTKVIPGFFSKFQKYWDKYQISTNIMVVCIGSIIGMMKNIFLEQKEPLFSRAQHILNLKKFNLYETSEVLKNYKNNKPEQILELYGLLDGIPKYLQYLDIFWNGSFKQFLNEIFLNDIAPLREEGKNILIQEFGSIQSGYFSILECISKGKRTPTEIANKTSMPLNTVHKYLHDLTNYYEIITRTYPITEDPFKSRNVRYFIADNFFRFWFRFIYPGTYNETKIWTEFDQYMGLIFENACRTFLRDIGIEKVGGWWKKDKEVDILGLGKKKILVAECKWSKKAVDIGVYFDLLEKTKYIPLSDQKIEYAIFSKSTFSDRLVQLASEENVKLYTTADVLKMNIDNNPKN